MRCKNCGKNIKDDKVFCPSCGEVLKEKMPKKKSEEIKKDSSDKEVIIDESIIQEESVLDDISSDSSISSRKRTFVICFGIVVCLLLIIGAIIVLLPDSKGNRYNYLKELETGMNEIYDGKQTDRLNKVLEYVADDDAKLNEVHEKSNIIVKKWVDSFKNEDLDNYQSFKDAEYLNSSVINKIYEYTVVNKSNDTIRILSVDDYNTLSENIKTIFEDGKVYYEALEYYHKKDFNNAYYYFEKIDRDNTYYSMSTKHLELIENEILTLLRIDIKKIESTIDEDNYQDSLKKYAQILNIVMGYDTVYEKVNLKEKTEYSDLIQKYNDKVSYFTELITDNNRNNE